MLFIFASLKTQKRAACYLLNGALRLSRKYLAACHVVYFRIFVLRDDDDDDVTSFQCAVNERNSCQEVSKLVQVDLAECIGNHKQLLLFKSTVYYL